MSAWSCSGDRPEALASRATAAGAQRLERHTRHASRRDVAEHAADRAGGGIVVAVGDQDQPGHRLQAPPEPDQEVEARLVRPVQVLDHQHLLRPRAETRRGATRRPPPRARPRRGEWRADRRRPWRRHGWAPGAAACAADRRRPTGRPASARTRRGIARPAPSCRCRPRPTRRRVGRAWRSSRTGGAARPAPRPAPTAPQCWEQAMPLFQPGAAAATATSAAAVAVVGRGGGPPTGCCQGPG